MREEPAAATPDAVPCPRPDRRAGRRTRPSGAQFVDGVLQGGRQVRGIRLGG